jgi:peptidoglycan/LPS O-acetylase OafA/YrhL
VQETGRRTADTRDRLYEIDVLRIGAAMAVVVYHYTFSGWAGGTTAVAFPSLSQVTRYGYLGVDLFFVISGFVVLLSAWGRRPEDFVISRIVRLYPAFWVAVTLTALVTVAFGGDTFGVTPSQYAANLTMLNALPNIPNVDVVYWTLWAEIRFYLLIFLLACVGITRGRVVALLWGWLATTFVLQAGVLPGGVHHVLDLVAQPLFSHYFIAGMAMCLIYRFGPSWQLGLIIAIALGNALFRGVGFAEMVGERYHTGFHPAVIVSVIAVIFCVMTLVALRVTRRVGRPWFANLGALTYPLYLIHAHIGFIVLIHVGDRVNKYVLVAGLIAMMCLAAYAIHAMAERPFAPLLKRGLTRVAAAGRHRAERLPLPRLPERRVGTRRRTGARPGRPATWRPPSSAGLPRPPAHAPDHASHEVHVTRDVRTGSPRSAQDAGSHP